MLNNMPPQSGDFAITVKFDINAQFEATSADDRRRLFGTDQTGVGLGGFISGNDVSFFNGNTADDYSVNISDALGDATKGILGFSRVGETISIFFNGELKAEDLDVSVVTDTDMISGNLCLGYQGYGNRRWLNGEIKDFSVYHGTVTPSQMEMLTSI